MKVKTSVSLSEELLRQLDEIVGEGGNRSQFIEAALKQRLREIRRAERNARDAAIYASLTPEQIAEHEKETAETLKLAVPWWELGDEIELTDEVEARLARENALRAAG